MAKSIGLLDPFGEESIKDALEWIAEGDRTKLNTHPLTQTALVAQQLEANAYKNHVFKNASALENVIRRDALVLEPPTPAGSKVTHAKRRYRVLHDHYLDDDRKSVDELKEYYSVDRSTMFRWLLKARRRLADMLREREATLRPLLVPSHPNVISTAPSRPPFKVVPRTTQLKEMFRILLEGGRNKRCALYGGTGMGKSTLALEVTHHEAILAHYGDGILWAGLGRKPTILFQLTLWAKQLNISLDADDTPHSTDAKRVTPEQRLAKLIRQEIGTRRVLLVMDDVWSIADAIHLDVGGPQCGYLLTTRFKSLAEDYAEAGAVHVGELHSADGFQLFQQFLPEVTLAHGEAVQTIVQSTGGLPLSLVLLARAVRNRLNRLPDKSPTSILQQVVERVKPTTLPYSQSLVAQSTSSTVLHQTTLNDHIRFTVESLPPGQQRAFAALVVFPPKPSTFSKEAVRAVSLATPTSLAGLVDACLIEPSGDNRYSIHSALSEYLQSHPISPAVQNRYVTYYRQYTRQHRVEFDLLDGEFVNVLAALDIAQQSKTPADLVEGINAFYPYLSYRTLLDMADQRLTQAQRVAKRTHDRMGLAQILQSRGALRNNQGKHAEAKPLLLESWEIAKKTRNLRLKSDVLRVMGVCFDELGERDEAYTYYNIGIRLARQLGDYKRLIITLKDLGSMEIDRGNITRAEKAFTKARNVSLNKAGKFEYGLILQGFANVAAARGEYTAEARFLKQSLAVAVKEKQMEDQTYILGNLGSNHLDRGQFRLARQYLEQGVAIAEAIDLSGRVSSLLGKLGEVYGQLGEEERARDAYERSLEIARRDGNPKNLTAVLANFGSLLTQKGDYDQARTYLQEALAIAQESQTQWHIGDAFNRLGTLAYEQGRFTEAKHYFTSALKHAADSKQLVSDANFGLAQVMVMKGNRTEAARLGKQSYSDAQSAGYFRAKEIQRWLRENKL